MDIRHKITSSLETYLQSQITKHQINIELMLSNAVASPEQPDIMQTIEDELAKVSEFTDKLSALKSLSQSMPTVLIEDSPYGHGTITNR